MLLDVNSPLQGQSIDRSNPAATYNAPYLNRTFAVVEAFKNYPNTLLFFAGNEVINDDPSGAVVPPFMRVSLPSLMIAPYSNLLVCDPRPQELHQESLKTEHPRGVQCGGRPGHPG